MQWGVKMRLLIFFLCRSCKIGNIYDLNDKDEGGMDVDNMIAS